MSYLKEFQSRADRRDFPKFLQLWEEYLTVDSVDIAELVQVFLIIKKSELAKLFGPHAETALPLWESIKEDPQAYEVLKLIYDLQTSNSSRLAELAIDQLKARYEIQPLFQEWLRLTGLRTKEQFQGALANFDLLAHVAKGKFVFHNAGWGVGEIMDISMVREQLTIEFENVSGKKDLSFASAFKTLVPLHSDSFLARRFANPDLLEQQAKSDPVEIIKLILKDLGPKTAQELKDELCELVIPEKDWAKWWSSTRSKLKKDPHIESPESAKDPFCIRQEGKTIQEKYKEIAPFEKNLDQYIQKIYEFVRDNPAGLKDAEIRKSIEQSLAQKQDRAENPTQSIQLSILLEQYLNVKAGKRPLKKQIDEIENLEETLDQIEVIAIKKQLLTAIRETRKDWVSLFLTLLFTPQAALIKDYLLKELLGKETLSSLQEKLASLLKKPSNNPETFFWYFQKLLQDEAIPYGSPKGRREYFEGLLILLHSIEQKSEWKDLVKKIYNLLAGKRYQVIRQLLEGADTDFLKEFLLLSSKCHTFGDHDVKILRSLAEVVDPSLATAKSLKEKNDPHVIWTTEEGYLRTQERIKHIGTVEIVDNAREIEAARALGDLRENSEYKFALERRSRLQSELKRLSDQLNKARIITKQDISQDSVGVGNIIDVVDAKGKKTTYTLLGPWDADPEAHILSSQSQFAQAMIGARAGDTFQFKNEDFQVLAIRSFFDKR